MTDKEIELLKSIYDVDVNDGEIRNIVWQASKTNDEYTRSMVKITE